MEQFKLAPLLERYDTVLFDLDGVMSSEEMYWNSAALAVYEMYYSNAYYGSKNLSARELERNLSKIRAQVFCDDRMIRMVKDRGVNSNWDLAYVVLGGALCAGEAADFEQVLMDLAAIPGDTFSFFEGVAESLQKRFPAEKGYFDRLGPFWTEVQTCFQEWFLGSELFEQSNRRPARLQGKMGLLHGEEPLVDKEKLRTLLRLLWQSGRRVGVGSGRPLPECEGVLECWDVKKYFTKECIISYDDVMRAEQSLEQQGIHAEFTKPHPFMFLKGHYGGKISDLDIYIGHYDRAACKTTLVVGDAGADLFAAKEAGCAFAAVLTGVQGQAARGFFEREKADYILNDVLALMTETSDAEEV